MSRLTPLSRDQLEGFEEFFQVVEETMGFLPNSLLLMAHRPDIMQAAMQLFGAVNAPGRLEPELKAMATYLSSVAAGCRYCQAHTGHTAERMGVDAVKLAAIWEFEDSPLFSAREKAVLRVALGAGQVPNGVTDADFAALHEHLEDEEIDELVASVSVFGFLNRWNDTLATPLEADPLSFATERLAGSGWEAGKHAPSKAE